MRRVAITRRAGNLIGFTVLLLVAGGALLVVERRDRSAGVASGTLQPRLFYGRVIDQAGNPVAGVEVVVQVSEMQPNPIMVGGLVADRLPKNRFSVYSGVTGSFLVMLAPPNHVVEIQAVKKEGYDWVTDWAWSLGVPPHNGGQNVEFVMPGRFCKTSVYQPDADRPAVFPLHRTGDASPATRPSRGGADLMNDGKLVRNEPTELRVPSAGAGAPATTQEINTRIVEYAEGLNAAARSKGR